MLRTDCSAGYIRWEVSAGGKRSKKILTLVDSLWTAG